MNQDFRNTENDHLTGLKRYVIKRYNVNNIKKKVFSRTENGFDDVMKDIMEKLCDEEKFGRFLTLDRFEKKEVAEYLKKLFDPAEEKLIKKIKPMIQAPNQTMMICLNELEEDTDTCELTERSLKYCIILLHEHLCYSAKQQKETIGNRIKGRSMYDCPNDSMLYTLYGYLVYYYRFKKENGNVEGKTKERIKEIFDAALEININNEAARYNSDRLK